MSKLSLVILAAGLGSRYGGVKQLEPVSESGATIIEHSIFDALNAGFAKFVFVTRPELRNEFEQRFVSRLRRQAEVEYVYQELDDLPNGFSAKGRTKPWGTGHAVYCARNSVNENFAVINADDFYGSESFTRLGNYLSQTKPDSYDFSMVGFKIENTLSDSGSVSRGICKLDATGDLQTVVETTKISRVGDKIIAQGADGNDEEISTGTTVSMNFWGFTRQLFSLLASDLANFLNAPDYLSKEFFLPYTVDEAISKGICNVKVLQSAERWWGITYKEDRADVISGIKNLEYPEVLF